MQRLRLPETVSAGAVIRQPCLFLIKGDPAVEPLEDGGHGIRAVRKLLKAFLLLRGFDEAEAVRIGTGPDTALPHGNMIAHPLKAARQGLFFLPLIFFLPSQIGLLGVQCAQPLAEVGAFFVCGYFLWHFRKELDNRIRLQSAQKQS